MILLVMLTVIGWNVELQFGFTGIYWLKSMFVLYALAIWFGYEIRVSAKYDDS